MSVKKFGVGQPMRRVEDVRLLKGQGQYTDDIAPENCLQAIVLRSIHAHARFTITNLDEVRALPGVALVLTAADVTHLGDVPCLAVLPNTDGTNNYAAHIPVLAKGVAKHVGDAIAFIVAKTLAQARNAGETLIVDYDSLPAVIDIRAALRPGAIPVWAEQPDNVACDITMGDQNAVDAIFSAAHRTIKIEVENNRLITNYMETRGCIGEYDPVQEAWALTLTSQGVHGIQGTLAKAVLRVDPSKVRVVTKDVGGGFGTKSFMYREYALVAEAA